MKNSAQKGEIAKKILAGIGLAGIAILAVAAPNVFQAFPRSWSRRYGSNYSKKSLEQSLANLKRKGQIKFVQGRTGWRVELTERGQEEFLALETREKILTRPKKWDKKWRLLVFDIPESKKKVRDRVRYALISFGFYRLQDSVWAYPYECEEILELLRTKYGVRYEALYIRAEKIAKDQWLQKHFNLL